MTNELTTQPTPETTALAQAGLIANSVAARSVFGDYQARKAQNTIRRQAADLALFAEFLASCGLTPGDLATNPESWRGITWGLVEGFMRWSLQAGYAIGSVNVRLATVKQYAKLAMKAGTLAQADYAMIMTVAGYAHKEQKHIDDKREAAGVATRTGPKKAAAVTLTAEQVAQLLAQPATPQGRRDGLLMALMLEHGLRVGEVARLTVDNFDLAKGLLTFYRPKVNKVQTHKLTAATLHAAQAYINSDAPALGNVWRASASKKDGKAAAGTLTGQGLSERAITERVATLGALVGAASLSAHDLRHSWATRAADAKTAIERLMEAGGWASPAMPLRYIQAAKIANTDVKLA